jgi:hypothetical protein
LVELRKGAIVVAYALGTKGNWRNKTYEKSFNDSSETIRLACSFINDLRDTTGSFTDYIFSFSDTLICIFEGGINFALKKGQLFFHLFSCYWHSKSDFLSRCFRIWRISFKFRL